MLLFWGGGGGVGGGVLFTKYSWSLGVRVRVRVAFNCCNLKLKIDILCPSFVSA